MNLAFSFGRGVCLLGDALAWPGERLFWIGDRICWLALYGQPDEREPDCAACNDEGITWMNDGWSAWSKPCASCDTRRMAETVKLGSVRSTGSAPAESGDAQPQSVSGLSHTGVDRG